MKANQCKFLFTKQTKMEDLVNPNYQPPRHGLTWNGLGNYPKISESLLFVADSLTSLANNRDSHSADILSGLQTNISILKIHADKMKKIYQEQKKEYYDTKVK